VNHPTSKPGIKCGPAKMNAGSGPAFSYFKYQVEVFYSQTRDLSLKPAELEKYLSAEEHERADRFHFQDDRDTFISSHAMLRLILSGKTGRQPAELIFSRDENNKPKLEGNPVFFNLTHTKNAFAFAVSRYHNVGIDMEDVKRSLDFKAILKTHFTEKDQDFVTGAEGDIADRFILLWTRKESLLKALGLGLVTDLKEYEVSTETNVDSIPGSDNVLSTVICNNHFIYTTRISDSYLSIATPVHTKVIMKSL
jgi:phosphopantetheinyl transferase